MSEINAPEVLVVDVGQPTSAVAPVAPVEAVAAEVAAEIAPVEVAPKAEEAAAAAKFAALSRREKSLKIQERQLAAKMKEFETKLAQSSATAIDGAKYIDREDFKKNPYKYMQQDQIALESIAEQVLNDGKLTPEKIAEQLETKLQAKITAMEAKLAEKEAQEQQNQIDATINHFKGELAKFVTDTPDYEMIRANDAIELVYAVIEQHCEATIDPDTGKGEVLTNKQASDMVEQHLLDQEKTRIEKYRQLTKTKALFEPSKPQPEQKVVKAPSTQTLTNTLAAQVPSKDSKTLTDEESKKEAAKLIKWNM